MDTLGDSPDESASLDLVARIQDGDERAWDDLYAVYHDRMLLTARMRLGQQLRSVVQSEDVFQSVAVDALGALQRFEYRGPGSLERFLNRLVLNKIRERARAFGTLKRSAPGRLEDLASVSAGEPDLKYLEAETFDRLEAAIRALPDELREILVLTKLEGHSGREVAELLGLSEVAVRKASSRAMAKLALHMTP